MFSLLDAAEAALRRSPAPALALSRLTDEVRAASGSPALAPSTLLEALRRHPDRFRILDPGRGPWRFVARTSETPDQEPWVLSLPDPDAPADGPLAGRIQRRLRASVRCVAEALDADSPTEVLHGHALALAGASLVEILEKEAA